MGLLNRLFGKSENKNSSKEKNSVDVRQAATEFEQKLEQIIENENVHYGIRKNIPPEALETAAGREIFSRQYRYAMPKELSYAITRDGRDILYIRGWKTYADYNHYTNRQIRDFCKDRGIKCLDFFYYLPNEYDYMANRIRENLMG